MDHPDFGYGRSVYKVMPEKVTMEEAELICGRTLPGGGKLLEVYSQDELDEIDFELIIRHRGYKFQYWLFGSLDEAFLYHKIEHMPEPGKLKTNVRNIYDFPKMEIFIIVIVATSEFEHIF